MTTNPSQVEYRPKIVRGIEPVIVREVEPGSSFYVAAKVRAYEFDPFGLPDHLIPKITTKEAAVPAPAEAPATAAQALD